MLATIWRLHIKQEKHVKVEDRCRFCVRERAAGMGWGVVPPERDLDWDKYCQSVKKVNSSVRRFKEGVQSDDLVWTRDTHGKYLLGRIVGEWEYHGCDLYEVADIHSLRPCEWAEVGDLQEVPGKVLNAFRASRTLQRIDDCGAALYSMDLFNRLSGQPVYTIPKEQIHFFSLFSPEDCEDLVGIYLQTLGYIVHPSTCKSDLPKFEFVLKDRTGCYAAVQVKTGGATIEIADYESFDGRVFLFQTDGKYGGQVTKRTTCKLDPDDIKRFCIENLTLMPKTIQRWVEWSGSRS
jgi:hypothetical protein